MLKRSVLGEDFLVLLKAAIDSIHPGVLINRSMQIDKSGTSEYLAISNEFLCRNSNNAFANTKATDNTTNTKQLFELNRNVYIVAFGKASLG
jgi:hypothetical protein